MFFVGGGGLTDRDPRLLKLASISGGATLFRCRRFVCRRELSCFVGLDGRNGNLCRRADFVDVKPG